jgi:hypothetical protein
MRKAVGRILPTQKNKALLVMSTSNINKTHFITKCEHLLSKYYNKNQKDLPQIQKIRT